MASRERRSDATRSQPRLGQVLLIEAGFALALLPLAFSQLALYWYAFPLMGLGTAYVVQFRHEFPNAWKVAFGLAAIIGLLGVQSPFSGHALWNTLFIGHASRRTPPRKAWMILLVLSMLHLFTMKVIFWRVQDVAGSLGSVLLGMVMLAIITRFTRPDGQARG